MLEYCSMADDIKVGDYVMVLENEGAIGFPLGTVKEVISIIKDGEHDF